MASALKGVVTALRTPKAIGLAVATVFTVVGAYATYVALVTSQIAFLGVIVFGVSVPTTLKNYDLLPDSVDRIAVAVVAGSLAHWTVFLALFVAAVSVTGELAAGAIAFVLTVVVSAIVASRIGGRPGEDA